MKNLMLYNGVEIPEIGFGTWQIKDGEEAYSSTMYALEAGYRHIDTAYVYGNEKSVGRAIRASGLSREELFITTKLPAEIKSTEGAKEYFKRSQDNLGLDYIDLYLIHAPWPWSEIGKDCTDGNIRAWCGMIDIYNERMARAIGVSNFNVKDIEAIITATGFKPTVNQIRYFIGNRQDGITDYCQKNGILVEAYSPLGTGALIDSEYLTGVAKKHNTTTAKICIAYCLQKGTLPLPKSVNRDRIIANLNIDITLDSADMEYLDGLNYIGPKKEMRS